MRWSRASSGSGSPPRSTAPAATNTPSPWYPRCLTAARARPVPGPGLGARERWSRSSRSHRAKQRADLFERQRTQMELGDRRRRDLRDPALQEELLVGGRPVVRSESPPRRQCRKSRGVTMCSVPALEERLDNLPLLERTRQLRALETIQSRVQGQVRRQRVLPPVARRAARLPSKRSPASARGAVGGRVAPS